MGLDIAVVSPVDVDSKHSQLAIRRVARSFDEPLPRLYSSLRFVIFRQRFMQEIGQYIPDRGRVLDIGCGVGLFANYFGQIKPGIQLEAFDIDARRVELARASAARLNLSNVAYTAADVTTLPFSGEIQAAYMIDTLHHIPRPAVMRLLLHLSQMIVPGGWIVIKDVLTTPVLKGLFTLALDRLAVGRGYVRYWEIAEMKSILAALGFEAFHHEMVDWIPYSQVLFTGRKIGEPDPDFLEKFLPGGRYAWGRRRAHLP